MNKARTVTLVCLAGGLLAGCVYPPPPPPRVVYRPAPPPVVVERPAPPPMIVERVPPPPIEHPYWVWRQGGWRWNGYRYVWMRGHYVERLS